MRTIFLPLALVAALLVGGCAGGGTSILQGGSSITASVKNPVGKRELAVVELSYQGAAKAFVACRKTKCTSKENLRKYQAADRKAYAAIVAARPAVRNNPNVSGLSAVIAARQAVADFNAALGR